MVYVTEYFHVAVVLKYRIGLKSWTYDYMYYVMNYRKTTYFYEVRISYK